MNLALNSFEQFILATWQDKPLNVSRLGIEMTTLGVGADETYLSLFRKNKFSIDNSIESTNPADFRWSNCSSINSATDYQCCGCKSAISAANYAVY